MAEEQQTARIPSLDGIRATAIGLVVYSHLCLWGTLRGPDFGIETGYIGVLIFFVISGYIITTSLLKGSDQNGISLRAFYLRRAARILPPYVAYICGLAILTKLRLSNASVTEILWSAAFVGDYRKACFRRYFIYGRFQWRSSFGFCGQLLWSACQKLIVKDCSWVSL